MRTLFQRFVKDESGATAIEYGLIAAGISIAILTVVTTVGQSLQGMFQTIADALTQAGPAAP
jgi:pilus assembly protein Flp/PilA